MPNDTGKKRGGPLATSTLALISCLVVLVPELIRKACAEYLLRPAFLNGFDTKVQNEIRLMVMALYHQAGPAPESAEEPTPSLAAAVAAATAVPPPAPSAEPPKPLNPFLSQLRLMEEGRVGDAFMAKANQYLAEYAEMGGIDIPYPFPADPIQRITVDGVEHKALILTSANVHMQGGLFYKIMFVLDERTVHSDDARLFCTSLGNPCCASRIAPNGEERWVRVLRYQEGMLGRYYANDLKSDDPRADLPAASRYFVIREDKLVFLSEAEYKRLKKAMKRKRQLELALDLNGCGAKSEAPVHEG